MCFIHWVAFFEMLTMLTSTKVNSSKMHHNVENAFINGTCSNVKEDKFKKWNKCYFSFIFMRMWLFCGTPDKKSAAHRLRNTVSCARGVHLKGTIFLLFNFLASKKTRRKGKWDIYANECYLHFFILSHTYIFWIYHSQIFGDL